MSIINNYNGNNASISTSVNEMLKSSQETKSKLLTLLNKGLKSVPDKIKNFTWITTLILSNNSGINTVDLDLLPYSIRDLIVAIRN